MNQIQLPPILKADWLDEEYIRPYVYVREENHMDRPGTLHHRLDWFTHKSILYKNPLILEDLNFAELIYFLEGHAFGPTNMAMPRWVFYDCAVMPGFVAGFAIKSEALPDHLKKIIPTEFKMDWIPLSLFIIIPTMAKGEWVAHNLCSMNSLLAKEHQYYALGFLSKAFGLWYANVETCVGMTQWTSPARKLHSHYGPMEILATYTPVHSHAETLTYRVKVNTDVWKLFFTRTPDLEFLQNFRPSGILLDPKSRQSLMEIQDRIEQKQGPYFLSSTEIASKKLDEPLTLYVPKSKI